MENAFYVGGDNILLVVLRLNITKQSQNGRGIDVDKRRLLPILQSSIITFFFQNKIPQVCELYSCLLQIRGWYTLITTRSGKMSLELIF